MRQIVALDEFHHEGGHAPAFFQAVDGRDVRVVQRREDFGFALKAGQSVRIRRQGRRKDLDGDLTLQPGVRRPIDLPHAAFAKLRGDFVDADASALSEVQGCGLYGRRRRRYQTDRTWISARIRSSLVMTAASRSRAVARLMFLALASLVRFLNTPLLRHA